MRSVELQLRSRRGFVLLEVVIAMGMFSFAIVGLAAALNSIISVELEARQARQVRFVIDSYMDQARLEQLVEETKALEPDLLGNTYQRVVEPVEIFNMDNVPLDGILRVTITATSPAGTELMSSDLLVYQQ